MIKVIPYIKTIGNLKFRDYLETEFSINLLNDVNNVPFINFKLKNMGDWYRFIDENGKTFEFYSTYYKITNTKNTLELMYVLPIPQTLNELINDIDRFNFSIYWNDVIIDSFKPQNLLDKNEIKEYYDELLNKVYNQ